MQTWIFQGNPDQFDFDAYLATSPTQQRWRRFPRQIGGSAKVDRGC